MATNLPTLAPRAPGQPIESQACHGSIEHTEQEWEEKKPLIRQLYIVEDRKLSQMVSILSRKHGFLATEQMYKKRFRKWNFRKRIYRNSCPQAALSSPNTPSLISKQERKDSVPESDGSNQGDQQIQQRVHDRGVSERGVSRLSSSPRGSVNANRLSIPAIGMCSDIEVVLSTASSWILAKLEHCNITQDPMSQYLACPDQLSMSNTRNMYRMFEMVFVLWDQQKGNLAGMAARKAFLALEQAMKSQHPDLLWHVLDIVYDMVEKGHLRLLQFFLGHASALCADSARHPVVQILKLLQKGDCHTPQGRRHVCLLLRQAWLLNVELLSAEMGKTSSGRLWLFEQLIWDGRTSLRSNSSLQSLEDTIMGELTALESNITEEQYGQDAAAMVLRICALRLEFTLMDLGDDVKAEQLALDLLHRTGGDTKCNARFQAYARKMLARIHEKRGNLDAASEFFVSAVSRREVAHGADSDLRVIRDMWALVSHLRRVGKTQEAEALSQKAIERACFFVDEA